MTVLLEPGQQRGRNKGFTLLNWGSGWWVVSGMWRWPRRAWLSEASVSAAFWYGGTSQQQSYRLSALARSTVTLLMGNIPCGFGPSDKLQAPSAGFVKESSLLGPPKSHRELGQGCFCLLSHHKTQSSHVPLVWCTLASLLSPKRELLAMYPLRERWVEKN